MAVVQAEAAARAVTDLTRRGIAAGAPIDLPAEAEPMPDAVRAITERVEELDAAGHATP